MSGRLDTSLKTPLSWGLVLGLAVAYALAFPWLVVRFGGLTRVFILPSLCLAAWFGGLAGGLAGAAGTFLLNWALFQGHPQPVTFWLAGGGAALGLGAAIGHMSDLRATLASQLYKTRAAEEALEEANLSMERLVAHRTAELAKANRELLREVAQRGEAEKRAAASEALHRAYLELSPDPIVVANRAGIILEVNPAAEKITGYPKEELVGLVQVRDLHAPEERGEIEKKFQVLLERGSFSDEFKMARKNGERYFMLISAVAVGEDRLIGFCKDSTQRRRDEEALKESEEKYRGVFEGSGEGILLIKGAVLDCNPAAAAILRRPREAVVGTTLADFSRSGQKEDRGRDEAERWAEALTEGPYPHGWGREAPDGGELSLEVTLSAVRLKGERALLALLRDVSARRAAAREKERLQRELLQAQKMEALGALAGGIAHDFNNLLAVILGYAERGLARLARGEASRDDLAGILSASKKARDLVEHILAFSRKAKAHNQNLDLNLVVEDALGMLRRTLAKSLEIRFAPSQQPARLYADPGQIEQLVLNLVNNAADAMPEGGQIRLSTRHANLAASRVLAGGKLGPGDYLALAVRDQGTGVPGDLATKIFEPFFTTKPQGRGTGLGLSTVYGIAAGLGGAVDCRNREGGGALFEVFLRARLGPESGEEEPLQGPTGRLEGQELLLLVDDEPELRELFGELFRGRGYQVLLAASGEEALSIYAQRGREIAVVILDLGMPGMGGEECFRRLREMEPLPRVIIVSGYGVTVENHWLTERMAQGFLSKPVAATDLLGMVRRVLDE